MPFRTQKSPVGPFLPICQNIADSECFSDPGGRQLFSGVLELLLCEIWVKWPIIKEVTAILVKIMKNVDFHKKIFACGTVFYPYMPLTR